MPRRNRTQKHVTYNDKNTCQSKRRFTTELLAAKAASLQELQNQGVFSVYKCERCGGWHLTRKVT